MATRPRGNLAGAHQALWLEPYDAFFFFFFFFFLQFFLQFFL